MSLCVIVSHYLYYIYTHQFSYVHALQVYSDHIWQNFLQEFPVKGIRVDGSFMPWGKKSEYLSAYRLKEKNDDVLPLSNLIRRSPTFLAADWQEQSAVGCPLLLQMELCVLACCLCGQVPDEA